MEKVNDGPPWWAHVVPFMLIAYGIYYLKKWRIEKQNNAGQSDWEKMIGERMSFKIGLGAVIGGILSLILIIYQDFTS